MVRTDLIQNSVLAACADLVEVLVTLTDHGFPNEKLCSDCVSQLIAALVLRTPRGRDCSRVAVLEDTTDEQLNIVRRNGAVIGRRVVVPKILALFGKAVSGLLRNTDFNAVADIAVIRTHSADGGITGTTGRPAIHKIKAALSPFAAVIGVPVTGKGNKAYFVGFFCCISGRPNPKQGGNAHQRRQKQRHTFFDFLRFHLKSSLK